MEEMIGLSESVVHSNRSEDGRSNTRQLTMSSPQKPAHEWMEQASIKGYFCDKKTISLIFLEGGIH
jgi:hypothetical protein